MLLSGSKSEFGHSSIASNFPVRNASGFADLARPPQRAHEDDRQGRRHRHHFELGRLCSCLPGDHDLSRRGSEWSQRLYGGLAGCFEKDGFTTLGLVAIPGGVRWSRSKCRCCLRGDVEDLPYHHHRGRGGSKEDPRGAFARLRVVLESKSAVLSRQLPSFHRRRTALQHGKETSFLDVSIALVPPSKGLRRNLHRRHELRLLFYLRIALR
mmetsp:Transcript_37510/g.79560  ORF Transcript_37510/g.79560 Transcript_37510/m.79560 type:complete len:211 (+) Transcript_37510:828-1460(+)